MSSRDTQRTRVYAAEEFVRTIFDRTAQSSSRAIDFFGARITVPPEARFGSVSSVRGYVEDVLALPAVGARWPCHTPLAVRPRRGATAAHYERRGSAAVIAVPDHVGWALRELVVLHEVAHHLDESAGPPHGPGFVATFCDLAAVVMGPEVGHILRVVYAKEGVR